LLATVAFANRESGETLPNLSNISFKRKTRKDQLHLMIPIAIRDWHSPEQGDNMKFQPTLLQVVEAADKLWLNGAEVKTKDFNTTLKQLTLGTDDEYLLFENQIVDVEFGAFKALTVLGTSRNFQAQMVRHIAKKDIS